APAAPVSSWGAQYATANGLLVLNGGVQDGLLSNATYAYDPAEAEWRHLPNADTVVHRGAAACGFGKFGGTRSTGFALGTVELLPGLDDCGQDTTDITWLGLTESSVTIPAGERVTVAITTDGSVPQPG